MPKIIKTFLLSNLPAKEGFVLIIRQMYRCLVLAIWCEHGIVWHPCNNILCVCQDLAVMNLLSVIQ